MDDELKELLYQRFILKLRVRFSSQKKTVITEIIEKDKEILNCKRKLKLNRVLYGD